MATVRRSVAFGALLVAGLSSGAVSLAGGATVADRSGTHHAVRAVPKGWRSYAYGGVMISVPKSWAVKHNTNCPNTSAPGALLLGYPKVLDFCADYQYSSSFVAIHSSMGAIPPSGGPVTVNGLEVDVGVGSPTRLEWSVPSLGLEVSASGPQAGRILHTLRRS
jgi:hypothetical protein